MKSTKTKTQRINSTKIVPATRSTPTSPDSAQPQPPRNAPGHWNGPFLSHTRRNGDAVALANEIYHEAKLLHLNSWLDVRMANVDEAAMKEGVHHSNSFVAVVTGPCINPDRPEDPLNPPEGNAYFSREYCLLEARCARDAGKKIICLVRMEDQAKVDEFFQNAPEDLRYLQSSVILFDRNDRDYQQIGVQRLFVDSGLCQKERFALDTTSTKTPPNTKHNGGVHWHIGTLRVIRTTNKVLLWPNCCSTQCQSVGILVL
jgi:hypothetical protein